MTDESIIPKVKPLGNQVIVRMKGRLSESETAQGARKSEGGVYIPDIADDVECEGVVVEIGDGKGAGIPRALAMRMATVVTGFFSGAIAANGSTDLDVVADVLQREASKPAPCEFKVGDRIAFLPWEATTLFTGTPNEVHIIDRDSVVGVL